MIKLYIAEDQAMLNSALVTLLSLEENFEIVGSALDGYTAYQEISLKQPDVIILDIEMPQMTGLEIAQKLREQHMEVDIIILTTFAQQSYFEAAVDARVQGYLLKESPTDELIETIYAVRKGETIYHPSLVRQMLRREKNPLTSREMDVLKEMANGLTAKEISDTLFLSYGTIRNYISSILSKTGSQTWIEAVNISRNHGWI